MYSSSGTLIIRFHEEKFSIKRRESEKKNEQTNFFSSLIYYKNSSNKRGEGKTHNLSDMTLANIVNSNEIPKQNKQNKKVKYARAGESYFRLHVIMYTRSVFA